VTEKETECAKLKNQIDVALNEVIDKEQEMSGLVEAHREMKESVDSLKEAKEEALRAINKLNEERDALNAKLQALADDHASARRQSVQLESDMSRSAEEAAKSLEQQRKEAAESLAAKDASLQSLNEQLQAARSLVEKASSAKEQTEAELAKAREKEAVLLEQATAKELEVKNLLSDVSTFKTNMDALGKKQMQFMDENAQLTSQLSSREGDLAKERQLVADLEAKIAREEVS
jgi:chromosome segregation ATPase